MSKRSLRLLVTDECDRACAGCCNHSWDLGALPVERDFTGYDEVLLTGGEPMLYPELVREAAMRIRATSPRTRIYLYTAYPSIALYILARDLLDGVTLTLHEQADVNPMLRTFLRFARTLVRVRSFRLNVFRGVELPMDYQVLLGGWVIKSNIDWIEDCPLPANEVFRRFEPLQGNP